MAAVIDTLRAARRLREANVPAEQAEAMAELLRETQEASLADLVTKADLQAATAELRHELAELRAGVRHGVAELRAELRQGVAGVRAELREGQTAVRGEISGLRGELKAEIASGHRALLMWLLPLLSAPIGALLYLLLRQELGAP